MLNGVIVNQRAMGDAHIHDIRPGPYPGYFLGGPIERRRWENRGAEGAEGVGCGEGVSPSPLKIFVFYI
jgi:hypothetical protein